MDHAYSCRLQTMAFALVATVTLGAAFAAEPAPAKSAESPPAAPARSIPAPDELEPAVDTTKSAPGALATPKADAAADRGAVPAAGTASKPQSGAAAGKTDQGAKAGQTPAARARKGPDRLELDTTEITGNRELPKVLYIVPWKRSDLGDLVGKPVNSLVDEVLQPLDRDVFQRQNRYYDALKPGQGGAPAGTVPDVPDKP
jgi:hypothetical protein